MPDEYALQHLTAPELLARAKTAPAVLLPLASVEILGGHGPLGADLTVAQAVTPLIAQRTRCLHAPAVPYGDTLEFQDMAGTVHIPGHTLEDYYYAAARSLFAAGGANAVAFLAFHSLNASAAAGACRRLTAEGYSVVLADWWQTVGRCGGELLEDQEYGRGHGAEMITSVLLALDGPSVRLEAAQNEVPKPGLDRVNRWRDTPFQVFGAFPDYCDGGAWGDISHASAEKGRELIRRAVEEISSFLTESL